jgi:hypothetical protein
MPVGIPISRSWFLVLKNGTPIIDWGNGVAVDLMKEIFIEFSEREFSHNISDEELDILKRGGRLAGYDARQVYKSE